jgi:hypothetical protein
MKHNRIQLTFSIILALTLLSIFAVAAPASSQAEPSFHADPLQGTPEGTGSNIGSDLLLSTHLGVDGNPSVAYNPAGQFLVVWQSTDPALGGGYALYGQFYDEQGEPQGWSIFLDYPTQGIYEPTAAYSPACDCYLVAWVGAAEGPDVTGLLFGSDGGILVNDLLIYDGADDILTHRPTAASNGVDFYVTWAAGYPLSVYGRRVNADGTMPYAAQLIAGGDGEDRFDPAVAYNPFAAPGEYLVVMQRGGIYDATTRIAARRVRADGSLPGSEYALSTDQPEADNPRLAAAPWDGDGGWVVTWDDDRNGDSDLFGRVALAGADASFDGAEFPIIAIAGSNQFYAAIARSPTTGQFLVTYQDDRNTAVSSYDLYAQRLDAGAALLGPEMVVSEAQGNQTAPAIAAGELPDVYWVVWEDKRTADYDVYGQRIAWNGALLQSDFAIPANRDADQNPVVAYDWQHDQYLAVWHDHNYLWGLRLSAGGLLLEPPWPIHGDEYPDYYPAVAYSDDADCFVVIWQQALGSGNGRLEGRVIPPAGDATLPISFPDSDGFSSTGLAYETGSESFLAAWKNENSFEGILAHALNQDGTPLAGDSTVVSSDDTAYHPVVAADTANHRYLVLWSQGEYFYGRLVGPYGNLIGDPFPVAGGDGLSRQDPSVAFKPPARGAGQAAEAAPHPAGGEAAGEYLVVYERDDGTGSSLDLYGQRLDLQGAPIGGEILIYGDPDAVVQSGPAVVYSPEAGRYYVIWNEDRGDGNEQDLYARWLNPDGSPASAALPVSRHPGNQADTSLAYDWEAQRILAVWQDGQVGGDNNIYAQLAAVDATPPTAAFTRDPIVGKEGDTFTLNAWPSSDDTTPKVALSVRWDWTSNGSWDTPWSLDKYVELTISTAGTYTITLQVRDLMSQTGSIALPIYVQPANPNTPPVAALTISPLIGQAGANLTFDATACTDAETPPANLAVRWDWENDGTWDTGWSTTKIATHAASITAGFNVARVEVRDGGNLTGAALRAYLVVPAAAVVLEIDPPLVSLVPGTEFQFRAEARDAYGNVMGNPPVTWSVTDAGAGTIGASGLFTAGLEAGLHVGVVAATWDALTDQAGVIIVYPYQVYLPVVMRNYP